LTPPASAAGVTETAIFFRLRLQFQCDTTQPVLPIETTTKLLKLHLLWPDRKRYNGKDDEAVEYFKWLFLNHHDRTEVMQLEDVEQVEAFIEKHRNVLWPTRKEENKWANMRLEPRIENDVTVELGVLGHDGSIDASSTLQGRTLDIGLHGMRLTTNEPLEAGSRLLLKVLLDDSDLIFNLHAGTRWCAPLEDGYLVGVRLQEDSDFARWQADFGKVFVAPAMAKRKAS